MKITNESLCSLGAWCPVLKTESFSSISAMNGFNIKKVTDFDIFIALCFLLQLIVIVQAGIFSKRTIYIDSFKYGICEKKYYAGRYNLWLKDFDILSTSYGDLDFTGTFITTINVTSPLKATVELKRNILGVNIKIPCIKSFGSCTFEDVCSFGYSKNEECPPLLDEFDVPCRCPIEPGMYNIPGMQLKEMARSRWGSLLAGKYGAIIKLYQHGKPVTCYKIKFTLE